ncbi:MAG TPA: guanitoxin biosynthesis L-enduracididine beta-hydroxylase GntD [Pyrinomonadaceae bacterium]|nr:guanitoxin biosynthesis L-enduracididine beta-hydroxylase GntD [Pyrinomonadaceae bacterium]
MNQLVLSTEEITEIKALLSEVASRHNSAEDPDLLSDACVYGHELPRRVRKFLNNFKTLESPPGICLLSGYTIDDNKIGNTPTHWKSKPAISPSLEEEILLVLFGSLLGDLLGWLTQQDGHIIHDVMPIKGHEHEQLGSSSEELLWWHTEDAFHPYRCDYLGMMCLRNLDQVETTMGYPDWTQLSARTIDILFEPRFTIHPDESHLEKNRSDITRRSDSQQLMLQSSYQKINSMNKNPEKVSILFGDRKSPYVRIDPYFMDPLKDDEEAQQALDELIKNIEANLFGKALQPGDFIFIDNYRVVHGRKPFKARFDGYDRWLKRANITRDLRKSRSTRSSDASHVIF